MTAPRIGCDMGRIYARREAEQRRERRITTILVCLGLLFAYGAVTALFGESIWEIMK
jgi:hypothetical protein